MLRPGDRIPEARVWTAVREGPVELGSVIAGEGLSLLCFYPFDWSPTCTNELLLLRDRRADLAAAGIRPYAISRDSPWSHASWAMTLGVADVPLLSDWSGEATRRIRCRLRAAADGRRLRTQRVPDRGRYGQGLVAARERTAGRRRRDRGGFVALAVALYAVSAIWVTWPAVRHLDGRYLARPAAGYGEAAAGDHLQLGWAFWLPGAQIERGAAPWADPYSFRPEATSSPNLQGWLYGIPFWPLRHSFGNVWAYNLIVLFSVVAAGGVACWWLRALGLARAAALTGGLVFAIAPYRVGQSTGHLLGLIAFLLPALLLALERRRFVWAAVALAAIPLSGQIHLAMGAVVLALGYTWARVPRPDWWKAAAGAATATAAAVAVQQAVVAGSIAGGGRSFAQVRHYSAELSDLVTRGVGAGIEEYVFLGWLTPVLALVGLWSIRRERGLALFLGLAAVVPCVLALGANVPLYEPLWRALPPLRFARVPERLMPIACLAIAALVAHAVAFVLIQHKGNGARSVLVVVAGSTVLLALLALDVRVPVFGAVAPDRESSAYAAIHGPGRLLELPVFNPGIHFGSVYLAYARQAPRERPQGYSTTATRASERVAERLRGLSCGYGALPGSLGVRFIAVHRGLYRQSGWFAPGCADRAESALRRRGWHLLGRDGVISTWRAPR